MDLAQILKNSKFGVTWERLIFEQTSYCFWWNYNGNQLVERSASGCFQRHIQFFAQAFSQLFVVCHYFMTSMEFFASYILWESLNPLRRVRIFATVLRMSGIFCFYLISRTVFICPLVYHANVPVNERRRIALKRRGIIAFTWKAFIHKSRYPRTFLLREESWAGIYPNWRTDPSL